MTELDGGRSRSDPDGASIRPVGPTRLRLAAAAGAAIGAVTALVGLLVLPWSEDPRSTFLDLATRPAAVDALVRPAVFLVLAGTLVVGRWWRAALAAAIVLSAGPTWLFPQLLASAITRPDEIAIGYGALAVGEGLACVGLALGLVSLVVEGGPVAEPGADVGRDDTEVVLALLGIGLVAYGWFQGRFELGLADRTVTDVAVASWAWPEGVGWVGRATWLLGLALPLVLVAWTLATRGGGAVARRQLWLGCAAGATVDLGTRLAAIGTSQPTGSFGPEIELAPAPTGLLLVVAAAVLFLGAGWRTSIALQGPAPAPIPVAPADPT